MADIVEIIKYARDNKCSDIHLTHNLPPVYRRNGEVMVADTMEKLDEEKLNTLIHSMIDEEQKQTLQNGTDIDFTYVTPQGERQRVNVYRQQGMLCAALRVLNNFIPNFADLGLPPVIEEMAKQPRGLVLITGPTGSGKSTTLAAIIDYINQRYKKHIITVEDPIEYIHTHKNSIVHQREVNHDVESFGKALRSSLREDPDVILVGEMRDLETISAAVTAAETGHLVLSTLHTTSASSTIDRIIDVFPPHSQGQIRSQLSGVLKGIVSQQLIPLVDGSGRCGAFEILVGTDGVLNLIREGKSHQLNSSLQIGAKDGMCTLNFCLATLIKNGKISLDAALEKCSDKDELMQYLR